MVFSTTNLFKGIPCPEGIRCKLTNCIYGHQLQSQAAETSAPPVPITAAPKTTSSSHGYHSVSKPPAEQQSEPSAKRRRVTYENLADKPLSRADQIKADLEASRSDKNAAVSRASHLKPVAHAGSATSSRNAHVSLARPVSPPSAGTVRLASQQPDSISASVTVPKHDSKNAPKKPTPVKKESLNPRLLTSAPESHAKRQLLLQLIHKEMVRLNNQIKASTQPIQGYPLETLKVLALSDQEVIHFALDEEEKAAIEQPKVYANVVKNRIAAFRKMKPEGFIDIIKNSFSKDDPKHGQKSQGKPIHTGLTPAEEVEIVHRLIIRDQKELALYGYIPTPPTPVEAEEAARAVEASMNYEECDRCGARFRVFPDRNEEGKLTTNGPCRHHPQKKHFPTRQKTDNYTGGHQPYYPCCMEQVGSEGCTSADDHVFKTSNPARLAAVLPFITTPVNPSPAKDRKGRAVRAVVFDCEMGYTALGLELIRLTAASWPEHELLLDVLVRPLGTIIELNSRFSGVFPEHFASAPAYSPSHLLAPSCQPLPIVSSPSEARALLCFFLTPQTPLIGHAIENDLNATRLCHPTIVDTMILYPHPRGLPLRQSLKNLALKNLGREIQMGGERGHDSLEDAVATGDLVRVKVGKWWKEVGSGEKGWRFEKGKLVKVEGMGSVIGKKGKQGQAGLDEDGDKGGNG